MLYFLSRATKTEETIKIISFLNSKKIQTKTAQDVALRICSLLNAGYSPSKLKGDVEYIVSQQKNDGSWEPQPFGIEKVVKNKKYYSSCPVFTTALCIEALSKYQKYVTREENAEEQKFYSQAIKLVKNSIKLQPSELRNNLLLALQTVLKNSEKDIILLPLWTNYIIQPKQRLNHKILLKLAEANLYGWMAYRIYDDFLDGQGQCEMLPCANWSLLRVSQIYLSFGLQNPRVAELFSKTMEEIEAANGFELHQALSYKFKNRAPLAQKSFGAALPALATILLSKTSSASAIYTQTEKFFWNYLCARQLNDDAHDWQEDLALGQITSVTALLLVRFKKRYPIFPQDLHTLQKLFWHKIIPVVVKRSENHLKLARNNLSRIKRSKYKNRFEDMLLTLEHSTQTARNGQKQTLEFLANYRNS